MKTIDSHRRWRQQRTEWPQQARLLRTKRPAWNPNYYLELLELRPELLPIGHSSEPRVKFEQPAQSPTRSLVEIENEKKTARKAARRAVHPPLIKGRLEDIKASAQPVCRDWFGEDIRGLEHDVFFEDDGMFVFNHDNSTFLGAAQAKENGLIKTPAKFFTLDGHCDDGMPDVAVPTNLSFEQAAKYVLKLGIASQITAMIDAGYVQPDGVYLSAPGISSESSYNTWHTIRGEMINFTLLPLKQWLNTMQSTPADERFAHIDLDYLSTPIHSFGKMPPKRVFNVAIEQAKQLAWILREHGFMESGAKIIAGSPEFMPRDNFIDIIINFILVLQNKSNPISTTTPEKLSTNIEGYLDRTYIKEHAGKTWWDLL